jgi:prepilin-type processing-associated H-X9-DG protein
MNIHRIFGPGEWLKERVWCLPCRSFRAEDGGTRFRLGVARVSVFVKRHVLEHFKMNYSLNPGGAALLRRQGEAAASPYHDYSFREIALKRGPRTDDRGRLAFTLVELLVVLATIALLAAVLLPALAGTKPDGQAFQCLNNTRRLTLCWTMYASENSDKFMDPVKWVSGQMDWGNGQNNTNVSLMLDSSALIAPYVKSAALFKCPSDIYQSPQNLGPRIRSYSLDSALGGGPSLGSNYAPGIPPETRVYFAPTMMSQLNKPGPANIYVILDENPDSINDGYFMLDAGKWPIGQDHWHDFPGSFHNGAVSISFADGHSEIHKWQKSSTSQSVQYKSFGSAYAATYGWTVPLNQNSNLGQNADNEWMEDRMPYR